MDNLGLSQGACMALASAALAAGTNAGTIKTAVIVPYVIDGVFYSRAIVDNVSIAVNLAAPGFGAPSNGSFTGAVGGSTRLYGLYLDAAGAISVVPGPVASTAALAAGQAPLQFPQQIRGRCFFGALRVAVTAGTTFIPGTTALNAAGVTATFLNMATLPAEPLRA